MPPLNIPDLHNRQVQKAHENRVRLARDLAAQTRAVELAAAQHKAALDADRDALAKALHDGRPEPKPAAGKAEQALGEARRRRVALAQAVEEAGQAVAAVIEAAKPQLEAQAEKRVEAARARFRRALEALEVTHAELAVEESAAGWLRQWPDGKGGVGQRYVTDLPTAPNGDPLTTDAVLDALRKRGLPPEPHRPRGALQFVSEETVVVSSEAI